MDFHTHRLPDLFSDWVESVFHYSGLVPDHSIERVVPTGHVFVIFELDGHTRHTFDNDTLEPIADYRKAWISGPHDLYLSISAHPDSEMLVIQFKPYGARPFLHIPMHSIANRVVTGDEFLDGELIALRDALVEKRSPADKFAVAEDWLARRYSDALLPPPGIVGVATALLSAPSSRLNDVLEGYVGSQKHLIELFKRDIGLTPKTYQRILRFNDVFAKMQERETIAWADIADQCGFSDQSHFIREFRRFSGFNPAEFIQSGAGNDEGNFFPLDRRG